MRHDPHFRKAEGANEGGKVFSVHVGGAIRHAIRAYVVGKVVSATVSYGAIAAREFWKVLHPHSVVLKSAVNEYDRLALAELDIREFDAIGRNPLDAVIGGHRIRQAGRDNGRGGDDAATDDAH